MPIPKLPPDEWRKSIPEDLKRVNNWVGHHDKVPCHPVSRRLAKVNAPETWGTFEEAFSYYRATYADPLSGVGLVFTPSVGVTAIDLDHMVEAKFTPEGRVAGITWLPGSEEVAAIFKGVPAYAELSPGGGGVHVFVRGELPPGTLHKRVLSDDGEMKLEVWDRAHYVTVTGVRLSSAPLGPNPVLIKTVAEFVGERREAAAAEPPQPERADEIREALTYISPDITYPEWIKVGMALKAGLGHAGKRLWVEWCRRGEKHIPGEPEAKWSSFSGAGVGLGSVVYLAEQGGFKPHRADAREAFADYIDPDAPPPPGKPAKPAAEDTLPVIVPASEVKLANIDWLWKPRIAIGELGLMAGEAGIGKSLAAIDIAARVTRGLPLPGEDAGLRRAPKCVLYLNGEDHPEATVRARLSAAGADLTKVYILQVGSPQLRLPSHITWLDKVLVKYPGIVLAIFDPLGGILDPGLDPNSAADIRKALNPLGPWGARHKLSPLVLHHYNKAIEKNGVYRIAGSAQIVGTSRHVMVVSPDPEAEDDSPVRLIGLLKTNAAKAPTYAFRIEETRVEGVEDGVGRIIWQGVVKASAKSLTEAQGAKRTTKVDKAAEWLDLRLASGEEVPTKLIFEEGEAQGFGEQMLRRASKTLNVTPRKLGGEGGAWVWQRNGGT